MSKKSLIIIVIVVTVIIGAAVAFLFILKEDPLVTQAKEEIRKAESALVSFQNTINAIPALELSEDVKNDFKMEAGYLGILGNLKPGHEGLPPAALPHVAKFSAALNSRSSSRLSLSLEDFDLFLENAPLITEVAREDLAVLEKTANTFDEAVKQAKSAIPKLERFSVERNKKTEKYFLEFDRIDQRLKALDASLDQYSSIEFRAEIKNLKSANEIFRELARYTKLLVDGKAGGYALNVAKIFPEVKPMEDAIRLCFRQQATCKPVGPFPGEEYQVMFQKLESLYAALIVE